MASGHASEAITAGRPGGRDLQRQIRKATLPRRRADAPARWQHTAGRSPIRPFRVRETAGVESPDGDSYRADCGSDSAHARDDEVGPITRDLAGLGLQLLALGLDARHLGGQFLQFKGFAG